MPLWQVLVKRTGIPWHHKCRGPFLPLVPSPSGVSTGVRKIWGAYEVPVPASFCVSMAVLSYERLANHDILVSDMGDRFPER